MNNQNLKKHERFRLIFQLCAAALCNGYAAGFLRGEIYTGKTKQFCLPVLNCYSCPGALGACPIGAMQAAAGARGVRVPFYALGVLMLFGTLLGRAVCGFLCPFGLIQDLLFRIPTPKLRVPKKPDRILRYMKYAVLLIFVLLLPALATDAYGNGEPWFCKYICPAGTLEGGLPLLSKNPALRKAAGWLFSWKFLVMVAVLAAAVFISRFFCRYLCPLGAFYALFHRFAAVQLQVDSTRCTGCGKCDKVCPMALHVPKEICSGECIRCGKCKAECPEKVIGISGDS